ncbi:MAG: ABC transporter permease [Verrucomicrobiales bacterium]
MTAPSPSLAVRLLTSEHLVWILCVALVAALAPSTPGLLSATNGANLAGGLAPLFLVALGQTLVILVSGIDLSVTSIIALASVAGALAMNTDTGWLAGSPVAVPAAIALMLALGATAGAANGAAVSVGRMPAFMVTLTAMMALSGLALWVTQSKNIPNLPAGFNALGRSLWPGLVLAGGLGVAVHFLLERTLIGRWMFACGQNPAAARVSGVPVRAVVTGAYVLSGLLAATASVLYSARLESGSPVLGQRMLLDVIAAVVIGGTSLYGGRARVAWTLSGVVFLSLLDNALNLRGLSHFTIMMIKGAVILGAAWLDALRRRRTGR